MHCFKLLFLLDDLILQARSLTTVAKKPHMYNNSWAFMYSSQVNPGKSIDTTPPVLAELFLIVYK